MSLIATVLAKPKSRVIVRDRFNRPDNNTSLGFADTGQTWEQTGHTVFGVGDNLARLYSQSGGFQPAVIDAGISDCICTVEYTVLDPHAYFIFRYVNMSNFWMFQHSGTVKHPTSGILYRRVAGSFNSTGAIGDIIYEGSVVGCICNANNIKITVDGVVVLDVTSSHHQSATKFGFGDSSDVYVRWNNFEVKRL